MTVYLQDDYVKMCKRIFDNAEEISKHQKWGTNPKDGENFVIKEYDDGILIYSYDKYCFKLLLKDIEVFTHRTSDIEKGTFNYEFFYVNEGKRIEVPAEDIAIIDQYLEKCTLQRYKQRETRDATFIEQMSKALRKIVGTK